ncbi:MAG: EAL domain-containing protein [Gammaproteobacteria bacterium]|nr:EAL domain-containing protein [Gammaproteobacteria bacterium]
MNGADLTRRTSETFAPPLEGGAGARVDGSGKGPVVDDARILLVDDKPELLESLYQLITLHGYHAEKALGGQAALDALARDHHDVVLLDLIMPGVSGYDVLDFVAREKIDTKIIVVSGDASFSGVKHALHCGAFDFVKKPYDAAELVATMETALREVWLENRNQDMEAQLRASEELHRFIVNSSPDLVYMLDRNGCFTFLNDRLGPMLGFEKSELVSRHFSELVDPEYLDLATNVFNERRMGSRAARNVEIKLRSSLKRPGSRFSDVQSIWVELTAQGVYTDPRERNRQTFVGTFGTIRDISERKEAQEVINFQAYHDLLTHLPNRALLKDRLELAITQGSRNKARLAVMFLDLDRFKVVNDNLGHSMGDRLLKAVANRLQSCLRRSDTLSRFGGDEFTLLLPEIRTRDDVVVIAGKILDRLNSPFVIDGHELFVGASIGIAMYPEGGTSAEALIQNADIAMYHIKSRGKNGYQFFAEEMNNRFSTRLILERDLRNGLSRNEFEVFYQPQVCLRTGRITGVEALVRWRHPERGMVAPGEFLPLAEETGLIIQLDEYVQRRAFADVAAWDRAGVGKVRVSVNVSAAQLEKEGFIEQFVEALESAGLNATRVKVEITENTLMQDMEVIIPKLKTLRDLGVSVAIDDFGTGYSSLSYLRQFPVNTLKIDRSFVCDIREEEGEGEASIINAIVAMSQGLKLDLIAEGVENRTQLNYLRQHGCSEVQGSIFSEPLPAAQMCDMLRADPFAEIVVSEARSEQSSGVAAAS